DFPWSMWATMQKFRMFAVSVTEGMVRAAASGARIAAGTLARRGKHQVADQAQPPERAPARSEQVRPFCAEDGGEEGAHIRRAGRAGGGAGRGPRRQPSPGQGRIERRPPQADGGAPEVPPVPPGDPLAVVPGLGLHPPPAPPASATDETSAGSTTS